MRKYFFEKEIGVLTDKNMTMGLEELLLDRAKKEGKAEGLEKGIEIGEEKTKTEFVENLIVNYEFSNEQIADMAKVSIEFIEKIRKELNKD